MATDLTPAPSAAFRPSAVQSRAKARLDRWLRENQGLRDLASLTKEELCQICQMTSVSRWLQDHSFQAWFFDREAFADRVQASRESALDVIEAVARDDLAEPKDRLRAAETLLKLAGAFPAGAPKIIVADRDLQAMDADELERERRRLRAELAPRPETT